MTDRIPANVFPPHEIIAEELAERGWSWDRLAQKGGLSADEIAAILAGERITAQVACKLEAALGTSAALWVNLDLSWRRRGATGAGDGDER